MTVSNRISTGRSAPFDGLVTALTSAKDGRTLFSSGGSLPGLFEVLGAFVEEKWRPVVSSTSLPSDVGRERNEKIKYSKLIQKS